MSSLILLVLFMHSIASALTKNSLIGFVYPISLTIKGFKAQVGGLYQVWVIYESLAFTHLFI